MQQYTNNTLINMELLIKELHKIREQGYAIETEQYLPGIRCIAAVSVAGPTVRITDEFVQKVIRILKKTLTIFRYGLGIKGSAFYK